MRIACSLASISRDAGGLFEICRRLALTVGLPSEVAVFGVRDAHSDEDRSAWLPLVPHIFPALGLRSFGFAPGYAEGLAEFSPDLVHVHGLWMHHTLVAHQWSQRNKRPVIFTSHGMLDPWALRNSGWKKKLVRTLFADRAHARAAAFQVNSEAEYRTVRAYGLRNPIAIIPNGIDLPSPVDSSQLAVGSEPLTGHRQPSTDRPKTLLYLGRLHPKKNLGPLIEAWASVRRDHPAAQGWTLAIAGWDQGGYEGQLRQLTTERGLRDRISFLGPKFGDEKDAVYRQCDAFILPSLSEGLPMVVLEAWAYAKPVLMTNECNLPEGFAAGAALRIGTEAPSITEGLRQLLDMSESERVAMGARGRALAAERFSWRQIGAEMRRVYEWCIGGGPAPASVRFD